MLQFIWHPNCSTCKQARAWLDAHGIAYQARDIRTKNPTEAELRAWQAAAGLPLKRFFNTSGRLYRTLALKVRLPAMPEAEQFSLLASDGMLVKRPLLVGDGLVLVGFQESVWHRAVS